MTRIYSRRELRARVGAWQCVAIAAFVAGTCLGLYCGGRIVSGLDATRIATAVRPVILTSRPCVEDKHDQCFVDERGREVRIDVRGGIAVPRLTP